MSLMADAFRELQRPITLAVAGIDIRYKSWSDGNTYPLDGSTIKATASSTDSSSDVVDGFNLTDKAKEFKIDVSALPVAPNQKDIIYEINADGTRRHTYMVLDDAGDRAVDFLDSYEQTYILRTKHVPDPDVVGDVVYGNDQGIAYGNDNPAGVGYGRNRQI